MIFLSQFPHVFPTTTGFTIVRRNFLTHMKLYLLRNQKFAKGNSFEADFRHKEVTDM